MKKFVLFLTILFHFDLFAAQNKFTDFFLDVQPDYSVRLDNFFPENSLSIDDVVQIANGRGYEEFLSLLHQRAPDLFDNVIILHRSGSLQVATPEFPRILIFGYGLVLSFSEFDPNATAERSVEIIGYEYDSNQFRFAELKFLNGDSTAERDPEKCQVCHGDNPRPIWQPYDFWPNIFGSAIGRLGSEEERDAYNRFSTSRVDKGIHSYINFFSLENNQLASVEAFNQYLYQLNFVQTARALKDYREQLGPFIYAVFGVLNQCTKGGTPAETAQKLAAFLPRTVASQMSGTVEEFFQSTLESRRSLKNYLIDQYENAFPNHTTIFQMNHDRLADEVHIIAQLRYLLENIGIEWSRFIPGQGINPYFISTPGNFTFDLQAAMTLYDQTPFTELQPRIINSNSFKWVFFDCDSLRQRSQQSLQGHTLPPTQTAGIDFSLLGECISCHRVNATRTGAPAIPFDRNEEFRRWLMEGGKARIQQRINLPAAGRMPPRGLSSDEKRRFLEVLETLAK